MVAHRSPKPPVRVRILLPLPIKYDYNEKEKILKIMNREQGKGGNLVIKRYGELWSNQKQIKELKTEMF